MMLKRYKNYSKRIKTDHWSQVSSACELLPRTADCMRLDMGILRLIGSEQGCNITP